MKFFVFVFIPFLGKYQHIHFLFEDGHFEKSMVDVKKKTVKIWTPK